MDVDQTTDPMLDPQALDPQGLDVDTVAVSNPAQRAAEVAQARRLAERYRLDYVDMATFQIDSQLFRAIPAELMLRYGFVPARREGSTLVIVVSDPSDLPQIDEIALQLNTPIKVMVGAPSAIQGILKKSESSQRVLEEATEKFQMQLLREDEQGEESLTVERLTSDISPIIRLVDSTIFTAIQRRASDIHIETQDDAVYVKYRIDGVLQLAMRPIGRQHASAIISRIKVMAELDIAEKRVPQDGRFKLRTPGKTIDFRVSIMPSAHGEDAVIRILDKESISEQFRELRLDILGFPEQELRRFRKYIAEPYGMVLVTGPTGSGKTTTLYAALSEIKSIEDKIVTIEDPVEYQLRGITQIPINEKKGLTFARGLRSILRHDPDKIMVGEIRDPGDGADRDPVGADRPPRVHDGPRQQRHRRAGPLPEHGRRAVPVRVGAQLRAGAAPGAPDLSRLQAAGAAWTRPSCSSRAWIRRWPGRIPSTRAAAASSAAAPASRAAWRSASCST